MANLGAADVPESLVLAMRALDEVCHIDGSLARVVPWVMSTLRATIAVARIVEGFREESGATNVLRRERSAPAVSFIKRKFSACRSPL